MSQPVDHLPQVEAAEAAYTIQCSARAMIERSAQRRRAAVGELLRTKRRERAGQVSSSSPNAVSEEDALPHMPPLSSGSAMKPGNLLLLVTGLGVVDGDLLVAHLDD